MEPSPQLFIGGAAAVLTVLSILILVLSGGGREQAGESEEEPAAARSEAGGASQNRWGAFRAGLAKTRQGLGARLQAVLGRDATLEARLADIEEALILADVGMPTTQKLLAALRRTGGHETPDALLETLKAEIKRVLAHPPREESAERPRVIVMAGVNGVGKTTSIAKLAHLFRSEGKRVLIAAADTFRAAAIEQLEVWAERVGSDFVKHQHGADPSAVAFDGVKAARGRGVDVAIIDTAGRLHVKANLMEELKKIVRVIGREMPGAPHEIFLVIDATTGQNALSQAREFLGALPLTGVILTKLDGTAKGGSVLAVRAELGVPVRYVGLGEGLDDLRPFDADAFTEALFET